jgi:dihydrofolate reductase
MTRHMSAPIVAPPGFCCVVAADQARGIGHAGRLPWPRLRADLAHLKAITSTTRTPGARNAVLMGRLTWQTIPTHKQPLPGRLNVVISRAPLALPAGVLAATSLDAGLLAATAAGAEQLYVLGGGQIFAAAIADTRCRYIYYTRIEARFDADAFFPPFEDAYVLEEALPPHHENGVSYRIERWARR